MSEQLSMGPAGGGPNVVSSGQVTPDRAGTRKGLNCNVRETEEWELIDDNACLASLSLAHQDRILLEVKESNGELI